jgi:hypothetical protein
MRTNKYGIRGLKGTFVRGKMVYSWVPSHLLYELGYSNVQRLVPISV